MKTNSKRKSNNESYAPDANVTPKDAEEFLPLAAKIPITPTVEEFPLQQANQVLCKIKHSKLHAAAVLKIEK